MELKKILNSILSNSRYTKCVGWVKKGVGISNTLYAGFVTWVKKSKNIPSNPLYIKCVSLFNKNKYSLGGILALWAFFQFVPKPTTPSFGGVSGFFSEWGVYIFGFLGILVFVGVASCLFRSGTFSFSKNVPNQQVVQPAPQTNSKPVVTTGNTQPVVQSTSSFRLSTVLLCIIAFGLAWYFVPTMYHEMKTYGTLDKFLKDVGVSLEQLDLSYVRSHWQYALAPIVGLFAYFFGDTQLHRRPFRAILITCVVAGMVYVYLHPEILKDFGLATQGGEKVPIISNTMGIVILFLVLLYLFVNGHLFTLLFFFIALFIYNVYF